MAGRDTRRVDGANALLAAPDGFAPYVQLSFYLYPWGIKALRRTLSWARNRSGILVVRVGVPINAPPLDLALDARSLYLFGFRAPPDGPWWCFRDYPRPGDPPGAPVRAVIPGVGSYKELGLPGSVNRAPLDLLHGLRSFGGTLDTERARDLVAMMLLVPEAIRFESLLDEGMRYLHGFTMNPAAHGDTVTNWASGRVPRGAADIAVPHLP